MITARFSLFVHFNIFPVEGYKFSKDFCARVSETARVICAEQRFPSPEISESESAICVKICGDPSKDVDFQRLIMHLSQQCKLLCLYGKNADLLNVLLDRYPEIREHPNVDRVISAYANLQSVINHLVPPQEDLGKEK